MWRSSKGWINENDCFGDPVAYLMEENMDSREQSSKYYVEPIKYWTRIMCECLWKIAKYGILWGLLNPSGNDYLLILNRCHNLLEVSEHRVGFCSFISTMTRCHHYKTPVLDEVLQLCWRSHVVCFAQFCTSCMNEILFKNTNGKCLLFIICNV